ncbi:TonB-dependent receptor [Alcanivorax sp. JB21]|uniref:TonB-dependent receptor n=1 Tax=Alcanivorax limicola TaxID=2874102 RepID=UPI001CBE7082|nr:TonB-dependent receptor [Alcanivorax limicola]MBZ2190175.1 TonB-dependent receptor [Alcanivorax limicola]
MSTHNLLAVAIAAALGTAVAPALAEETRQDLGATGIDRARAVSAGTQFNPQISVILDGVYYNRSRDVEAPAGFEGGHDHGHDHGDDGLSEGFNLRETEITLSASIDNYLDGVVTLALEGDSGIEVEEAYLLTRTLPAGLQVKAGRFLSDIGYINRQHPHDWLFVDRPLVSELLFGEHGLQDNGLQLAWLAPTPFYSRLGVEVLQGQEGFASYIGEDDFEEKSGPRLVTAFAKVSPDTGFNHATQFGISGGYADAFQRQEEHSSGRVENVDGNAWFAGVDAVYKYDAGGQQGHGNWVIQGEYYFREVEADYANIDGGGVLLDEFFSRSRQDGLYVQAVYGVAPRWNAGLRAEAVGLKNKSLEANGARNNFESFDTSYRYAAQVSFAPTEFSRLRAQVNYNDFAHDDGDHAHDAWEFMLQYNVSLGAHGAHQF